MTVPLCQAVEGLQSRYATDMHMSIHHLLLTEHSVGRLLKFSFCKINYFHHFQKIERYEESFRGFENISEGFVKLRGN